MDRKVYCVNASTGALIWSYRTGGMLYGSSPAIANGAVYIGSIDKQVYAFGTEVIPEGLTFGVMLLLSTVAVIVGASYFRKRPKWKNW
jgi:hypothetical protein